ncbi:MAG: type VI secretion system protein TssA [Rhodocyclaceae bacterium]|nr:type VI secretion system protein TssA [Rhodocyclaceae bacterium]MBX3668205.1 type VI secretion system protein TssA [Rhodocyclaceae bacterium]
MTNTVEQLLQPVPGDLPTGTDLEYDLEFQRLERESQGTAERVVMVHDSEAGRDVERTIPGEDPDWSSVARLASELLGRSKDLRIAMYFTEAQLGAKGLPGFDEATAVMAGLLENFWDGLHPMLDPDDPYDPIRTNALLPFDDPKRVARVLRNAPFVESREVGRFTLRDIEVAHGDLAALPDRTAATLELLSAAARTADAAEIERRRAACHAVLANFDRLRAAWSQHGASWSSPAAVVKLLKRAQSIYDEALAASAPAAAVTDGQLEFSAGAPAGGVAVSAPGRIASRSDAKRMLEQVCQYLEQAEPGNPAPILIRRAIRVIDKSFMDVIRDLAPDAISHIELLAGTNLGE